MVGPGTLSLPPSDSPFLSFTPSFSLSLCQMIGTSDTILTFLQHAGYQTGNLLGVHRPLSLGRSPLKRDFGSLQAVSQNAIYVQILLESDQPDIT